MDADTLRCKPYRIALLLGMMCTIPLGYIVRFSKGLNAPLLQDIGGSLAYQILLMLGVAFLFPRLSLVKCAVCVEWRGVKDDFVDSEGIEIFRNRIP